jgi:putative membrane protein insertion efficiency factor
MLARVLLVLIRVYQLTLSPMLGNVCRFEPSCSRYAAACIASHGALRGSWLAGRRLLKCHPFHPGGYDPPPPLPEPVAPDDISGNDTVPPRGR